MSKKQLVDELHKPARRNFKRRRVVIKGLDDLWQADLVEMGPYAKKNNGYKFLLTVIDVFSKYAWAIPVKRKTGVEVTAALTTIFKEGRVPKNLQTDDGKEFFNQNFEYLIKKYKVNHYSTFSPLKASVVERFNRTLKNMMWKEFSMIGTYRWIDMVKKLILTYNTKKHRTIKMKPSDVNKSNERQLLNSSYKHIKVAGSAKYKVGDFVRISKYKHVFQKGYTPNWTTEIFKIREVQITNPVTYLLEDYQGRPIKGGFYELELQKVENPNLYLVEKILKRNGDKVYVKWLGFSSKHNSWIDKKDVL